MLRIADAHCDTLTKWRDNPFNSEDAHWSLEKFIEVGGSLQYFALFTPPNLAGTDASYFVANHIGLFNRTKPENVVHLEKASDYDENKVNILLSIEGATPIINDINNLYAFYKLGVRAMGLTWNHRNFLADGVDEPFGLTSFGKEVVSEMEKLGMIVDVSHLNVAGFDDILKITEKPFIASHSNARSITEHPRNLYDEQIKEIIHRKGFIGLNFYSVFLANENEDAKVNFFRHVEHFLKLGAEDVLGLGADFDGIDATPFEGVSAYKELAALLHSEIGLGNEQINKIMYKNLRDYTLKML